MEYIIKVDNEQEHRLHLNGPKMYAVVWELITQVREQWKYKEPDNETWWELYQMIWKILEEEGIDIESDYN